SYARATETYACCDRRYYHHQAPGPARLHRSGLPYPRWKLGFRRARTAGREHRSRRHAASKPCSNCSILSGEWSMVPVLKQVGEASVTAIRPATTVRAAQQQDLVEEWPFIRAGLMYIKGLQQHCSTW